jgi:N-acyl-D-amino-acid deacylase
MSILVRNVKILGSPTAEDTLKDVLVTGQTISAVGKFSGKRAEEVIDGQGGCLTPGFIDLATTSDHFLSVFTAPRQEDFIRQGVTTIVGGHCGASLAPLLYGSLEAIRKWADPDAVHVNWHTMQELFQDLSKRPMAVNFGTLAGHSTIRRAMLGDEIRDLTENEIAVFKGALERALQEGAFGLSFGLASIHARSTAHKEMDVFAEAVAAKRGMVALHLRSGDTAKSAEEAIALHKESGAFTLVNHFVPRRGDEKGYEAALAAFAALPQDANCYFGLYPFAGTVDALYRLLPEWAQNGPLEVMVKNVQDDWLSKRVVKELPEFDAATMIIETAPRQEMMSRTLKDYMEISGITDVRQGLLHLMKATKLRAVVSMRDINESVLKDTLWHPRALITSHAASLGNAPQGKTMLAARSRRTMTEFLRLAEEKGVLNEAVRRITALPAAKLNLPKRGAIQEGYFADLALLKNGEVKTVVVNGTVVVRDGVVTGALPGSILRRS